MMTLRDEKLRDEFAKHALIALTPIAWKQSAQYSTEADLMRQVAESCYLMADAMMEARKIQIEGNE